jgi:hypothetical protein
MTAKTIADHEKKAPKQKGELPSSELDKVTGGMKPTGAAGLKTSKNILGDPCEGGE